MFYYLVVPVHRTRLILLASKKVSSMVNLILVTYSVIDINSLLNIHRSDVHQLPSSIYQKISYVHTYYVYTYMKLSLNLKLNINICVSMFMNIQIYINKNLKYISISNFW